MAKRKRKEYTERFPKDQVVLPAMTSQMEVSLRIDHDGNAFLFHDRPLQFRPGWAEYYHDRRKLVLVSRYGQLQDVGFNIADTIHNDLMTGENIKVAYMKTQEEMGILFNLRLIPQSLH